MKLIHESEINDIWLLQYVNSGTTLLIQIQLITKYRIYFNTLYCSKNFTTTNVNKVHPGRKETYLGRFGEGDYSEFII